MQEVYCEAYLKIISGISVRMSGKYEEEKEVKL